MDDLKSLFDALVEGRVFSPRLPYNGRGKTTREKVACDWPAVSIREMAGPDAGMVEARVWEGSIAKAKAVAREAVSLIQADGRYELVGKHDLKSVPQEDPDGRVVHVALKLKPI